MMEKHFCVIFLFCISTWWSTASGNTCNFPAQFWCDTEEIAEACGVYHQCKQNVWTQYGSSPLVDVTLYYETLCPDCRLFIKQQLYPAYKAVGVIMNITLVPYGNAQETWQGTFWQFTCQHGREECDGNMIETCTIAIMKNISDYMPFIHCIETTDHQAMMNVVEECAKKYSQVPLQQIIGCALMPQGNNLEHQMALKTKALKPQHTFVPWVTLNGVHTDNIQRAAETDLIKLVCDSYKGVKPAACQKNLPSTKGRSYA